MHYFDLILLIISITANFDRYGNRLYRRRENTKVLQICSGSEHVCFKHSEFYVTISSLTLKMDSTTLTLCRKRVHEFSIGYFNYNMLRRLTIVNKTLIAAYIINYTETDIKCIIT